MQKLENRHAVNHQKCRRQRCNCAVKNDGVPSERIDRPSHTVANRSLFRTETRTSERLYFASLTIAIDNPTDDLPVCVTHLLKATAEFNMAVTGGTVWPLSQCAPPPKDGNEIYHICNCTLLWFLEIILWQSVYLNVR